jgi:2-iminobutanoate/2-iminopropanoate deaminase
MKRIINTLGAPSPVGPYNQAVLVDRILFVSGQIAINPKTGQLVQENIVAETHQVMKNLLAILIEAGASFEDVVKCTVFVKDMHLYGQINEAYASYFDDETAPARELVEVSDLPKFVNVEISAIAFLNR